MLPTVFVLVIVETSSLIEEIQMRQIFNFTCPPEEKILVCIQVPREEHTYICYVQFSLPADPQISNAFLSYGKH